MRIDLDRDLRTYLAYLDEVLPTITAEEATARDVVVPSRVPRRLRGWTVALGAAVIVIAVLGGLSLLVRSLRSDAPVDPAATVRSPWLVESLIEFPVDEYPAFSAVYQFAGDGDIAAYCIDAVRQYLAEHPDQSVREAEVELGCTEEDIRALSSGPAAAAVVSFAGPSNGLRVEVSEAVGWEGPNAGAGSYLIFDGERAATYLEGGNAFLRFPEDELVTVSLGEFGWTYWAQLCGPADRQFLDGEVVAGRETVHLTCDRLGGEWELWVDAETGVVLQMEGTAVGPIMDQLGHSGYWPAFTVDDIEYSPSFASDLFSVHAPAGAREREMDRFRRGALAAGGDLADGGDIDEQFDEEPPHPLVGNAAPPLVGTDLDGQRFDLAQLQGGRVAVLFWWPECSVCVEALDVLNHSGPRWSGRIALVAVAVSSGTDLVSDLVTEGGLTIPLIVEPDALDEDWRLVGAPALYLIDEEGVVTSARFGFDRSRDYLDEPGTLLGDVLAALD